MPGRLPLRRTLIHAACLAFTAWALIATSAPNEPARDCFTGIPQHTRLRVTVGPSDPTTTGSGVVDGGAGDGGVPAMSEAGSGQEAGGNDAAADDAAADAAAGYVSAPIVSCNAIDGLAPGAVLVFDVTQGARPDDNGGACYGYATNSITGLLPDVWLTPFGDPNTTVDYYGGSFTSPRGTFSWPQASGCLSGWVLGLGPRGLAATPLVSPLDAGPDHVWLLVRGIGAAVGQLCNPNLTTVGPEGCQDTFTIQSIVESP